jgi:phosphatidate phosphatase APP1
VISDIDDTIKITEVRNRHALLRNTFLREFTSVPRMAEFYQLIARSNDAQFHYVSASPWQLHVAIVEFLEIHNFPRGTFVMKEFRWKNRTFLSLFSDPEKYKPTVIEPLLKRFPKRHFILIGDSGERDPEIYAALARQYPEQIAAVYIRDVTGESATTARYTKAFRGLPNELWQVFSNPSELKPFVDTSPTPR